MLAPLLGVLLGLDQQKGAALAEHKAVAVPVEWAACTGGVVVVGGHHDAHLSEPGDGHRFDPGLHAAADGGIGLSQHNLLPRTGDGLGAGCARRYRRHHPGLGVPFQPDAAAAPLGMYFCTVSGETAFIPRARISS